MAILVNKLSLKIAWMESENKQGRSRHPVLCNPFQCQHGQIVRSREWIHELVNRSLKCIQHLSG